MILIFKKEINRHQIEKYYFKQGWRLVKWYNTKAKFEKIKY